MGDTHRGGYLRLEIPPMQTNPMERRAKEESIEVLDTPLSTGLGHWPAYVVLPSEGTTAIPPSKLRPAFFFFFFGHEAGLERCLPHE